MEREIRGATAIQQVAAKQLRFLAPESVVTIG